MSLRKKRVLFLVTEDWYFCSHRLALAVALRDAGYDVKVATRVVRHGGQITDAGLTLIPIKMRRRGKTPLFELRTIVELIKIYRREKPDLVHHVALKPVLYGSIAAQLARVPACVNAVAGLGFIFSSRSWYARSLRPVIQILFRLLLNRAQSRVILQNPDDRQMMVAAGVLSEDRVVLIRGAGVDLQQFCYVPEPSGSVVVVLASRMLRDKGVGEFVAAAEKLKNGGIGARFVLVGDGDPDNPASIPDTELRRWHEQGAIEWWGRKENISQVMGQANIVCLPSYREGLPKVLLEAAACGRAIVTTDVPGCREIVRHEMNGLLVPSRNSEALAKALKYLIDHPDIRYRMGRKGRDMAKKEFSVEVVIQDTLALYRDLLKH